MRVWLGVGGLWLASVVSAFGQTAPAPPVTSALTPALWPLATPVVPPSADVSARLLPRPRLRVGESFSIELTSKVQGNFSAFDPVVDVDDEGFAWTRQRLGLKGELFNRVTFEIEREFDDDDEPWRDVYLNVKASDLLEVRGGKFKVPFGRDNLTSATSLDFVSRSLVTREVAPGRDRGGMVHGRMRGRRLTYAVGVFAGDGVSLADQALEDDDNGGDSFGRSVGARVTVQPFDAVDRLARSIRNFEIGVNGTWSTVPAGLNGFPGRSVHGYRFFEPVYVNGDRVRAGIDAALLAGPTSLKAEWLSAWDDRREQGLGDADLPRAFARGWYVSGTWLLTGEDKSDEVHPTRPFLDGGLGAFELGARYEQFLLGSTGTGGEPPFANPRAANLLRNQDDVTTLGLSWYLNRWFRLQGNAIYESFADVTRAPIPGRRTYWSYVGRVQFSL